MTKQRIRKPSGFTLIELMIVVAIIGILAAIAIPNFIRYQLRSKSTEAKTVLGGIKTSQESFRAEYDNYAAIIPLNPTVSGGTVKTAWEDAAARPCPNTCNRLQPDTCTEFTCIGYQPSGQVYYQYDSNWRQAAVGTTAEFTSGATADLDGDTLLGAFSYGTANDQAAAGLQVVSSQQAEAAANACAAGVAVAGEVVDCQPSTF